MVTRSVDRPRLLVVQGRRFVGSSVARAFVNRLPIGRRPGKPVNRFFVVKVLELHSLIAGDFGFPEIDCADQKGRKRGREETRRACCVLRAAAGPIHRSHRRRILPNLRNAMPGSMAVVNNFEEENHDHND